MKKLLVTLFLILASTANAQVVDWTIYSQSAAVSDTGDVTITLKVPAVGTGWTNAIARVQSRIRYSDGIINDQAPYWIGFEPPSYDYAGLLYDPSHVTSGDTATVTIDYDIEWGNIVRYIGSTIQIQYRGVFGTTAEGSTKSDWIFIDADAPDDYTPASGISVSDSCGFAAVSIYLKPDMKMYSWVKWEWYDAVDDEWKFFVPLADLGSGFNGIVMIDTDTELLYSVAYNNFGYIGARTDGSTRFLFLDAQDDTSGYVTGPNVLNWCGIIEDTTPPTLSGQSTFYNGVTGYNLLVTMNEACTSRYRYRIDGGAWTSWTEFTSTYNTNCSATYYRATRDVQVDFEMEVKDQADLEYASNPITDTILPE